MKFNLTFEEARLQALKAELGISPQKAHCLHLELWRYSHSSAPSLECRVSLFTNNDICIQGRGSNFGDALDEIRVAVTPKSLTSNDTVTVITPSEDC